MDLAAAVGVARSRADAGAVTMGGAGDRVALAMRTTRRMAKRRHWTSAHGRLARIARAALDVIDGGEAGEGIEREALAVAEALRSMRGEWRAVLRAASG